MDSQLLRFDESKTYVTADVETENLNLTLKNNLFWQAAFLLSRGSQILDAKAWYLKWHRPLNVSPEAAKVTHYNPFLVEKEGIDEGEVFPIVYDYLKNCDYILGLNLLGFDIYLLKDWHKRHGKDFSYFAPKVLDLHPLAKGLKISYLYKKGDSLLEYQYRLLNTRVKGIKTNLQALLKEENIEFDPNRMHEAGMDVQKTFELWNKLKWKFEI